MVLVQKSPFFQVLFLGNKAQDNVSYDILEQTKSLSRLLKQEVQKVEKLTFMPLARLPINHVLYNVHC